MEHMSARSVQRRAEASLSLHGGNVLLSIARLRHVAICAQLSLAILFDHIDVDRWPFCAGLCDREQHCYQWYDTRHDSFALLFENDLPFGCSSLPPSFRRNSLHRRQQILKDCALALHDLRR